MKTHPSPRLHAFLQAIRNYPSISRAAKAAGISRSAHYNRYERDAAYAIAFDRAWRWGRDLLSDVANERVLDGIEEPVIYQGQYQYEGEGEQRRLVTIRKYPERLHMAVLRGEHPEKYNRQRVEVSAPGGGALQHESSITIRFVDPPAPPAEEHPDDAPPPNDHSDPSSDDD